MKEVITVTLGLITALLGSNDKKERRRNLRAIKRNRRKIYKAFKKDGFTEEELVALKDLDHAWVQATLKLGKY